VVARKGRELLEERDRFNLGEVLPRIVKKDGQKQIAEQPEPRPDRFAVAATE